MRISPEQFTYGMGLLSLVHGDDHPVYKNAHIAGIWYKFFATRYSNDKFLQMIDYYLGMSHWFPKAPNDICKVWEESGDERSPGENWLDSQQAALLSLPSQEAADIARQMQEVANLSPEQMAENKKRVALLYLIVKNLRSIAVDQEKIEYLHTAPLHELEAIAKTCEKAKKLAVVGDKYGNLKVSPDALFEDMQKYFHSGSDKYRQLAINWASNPNNGCELVKDGGRVVDLRLVDF